jgi:hypothetical protein
MYIYFKSLSNIKQTKLKKIDKYFIFIRKQQKTKFRFNKNDFFIYLYIIIMQTI